MLSLSSFVLPSYVVLVFSTRITLLWIFLWPLLGRFLFSPLVLVSHYFTQKRTTTLVLSPYIVVYVLCCRRMWSDEDLAEYSNQSPRAWLSRAHAARIASLQYKSPFYCFIVPRRSWRPRGYVQYPRFPCVATLKGNDIVGGTDARYHSSCSFLSF